MTLRRMALSIMMLHSKPQRKILIRMTLRLKTHLRMAFSRNHTHKIMTLIIQAFVIKALSRMTQQKDINQNDTQPNAI